MANKILASKQKLSDYSKHRDQGYLEFAADDLVDALVLVSDVLLEVAKEYVTETTNTTNSPQYYYVVSWETGKVLETFKSLGPAKRCARALGHDPTYNPMLTGYAPIAYVGNGQMEVVYNPRFNHGKRD